MPKTGQMNPADPTAGGNIFLSLSPTDHSLSYCCENELSIFRILTIPQDRKHIYNWIRLAEAKLLSLYWFSLLFWCRHLCFPLYHLPSPTLSLIYSYFLSPYYPSLLVIVTPVTCSCILYLLTVSFYLPIFLFFFHYLQISLIGKIIACTSHSLFFPVNN